MGRLDRAGGLWLHTDKNGRKYMAGEFERDKLPQFGDKIRISIFRNTQKQKATHPDYVIFLDEPQGRE